MEGLGKGGNHETPKFKFDLPFSSAHAFGFTSGGIAQTIKVGAVVPLTGRYAALGAQVRAGYEIGVEQINAARWSDRRRQEDANSS